jgi:acyl carrier protein
MKDGHPDEPFDEVVQALKTIVSEVLKVAPDTVTLDSRLTEIAHVESIKLLRIAGRIERRFGIELDNEAMFRDGTLRDIAAEIGSAGKKKQEEAV